MIHLNETLYACGLACSTEGKATPSGTYLIDLLLANICKLNVTRFPYEIARIAEDLAGGLMVTLPSEADLRNPVTGPYMEKYLQGVSGLTTECRLRMLASGRKYNHRCGGRRLQGQNPCMEPALRRP